MKRFMVVMVLLLLFFVNAFYLGTMIGRTNTVYVYASDPLIYSNINTSSTASLYIPAIDENEQGVVTLLTVQAIDGNGTGKILVNIDRILFWGDTQDSIRTARDVAKSLTDVNINKIDLVYTITANASVIEGPSAGAALSIATVAAVENQSLRHDVIITGAIEDDGSISQVGGITAKAKAAKKQGAVLFLVPVGQLYEKVERIECDYVGLVEQCSIVYQNVNVAEEAGIEVVEVSNINEALNYFLV